MHNSSGETMDNRLTAGDLMDLGDLFQISATLFTAVDLKVFDYLSEPRCHKQVASEYGWVPWKAEVFLKALVSQKLLKFNGESYYNSEISTQALVTTSKEYIGDALLHEKLQWQLWNSIDDIMKTSSSTSLQQEVRFLAEARDNEIFHRAMRQLAQPLAKSVTELQLWKQNSRILDLAGGHGLYLVKLLQKLPLATGEIWDLSTAENIARETIREANLEDRITFYTKDITDHANYASSYFDHILINHCLHHFSPQTVKDILSMCLNILSPNGSIIMIESRLEKGGVSPPENAMFSLYMMVNTQDGRVHEPSDICQILQSLGLDTYSRPLNNPGDDVLMVAHRR